MDLCLKLSEEFQKYLSSQLVSVEFEGSHEDLIYLLTSSYEDLKTFKKYSSSLEKAIAVQDRSWEILNIGRWCDAPFSIRKIYSIACLIKLCCTLHIGVGDNVLSVLSNGLSTVDDGLLLGAGLKEQLTAIASKLSDAIHCEFLKSKNDFDLSKSLEYQEKSGDWDFPGVKGEPVVCLQCPSLETFSKDYFNPQLPAKLKGSIDHWPALHKWKDVSYLLKVGGSRKVPIELGSQYTESDWSMKLCTLRDFITDHIIGNQPSIGYLAQHQLFNQVPELHDDIRIPEYCCISGSEEDSNVDINAWFGPGGTVSPLHHDPKHNLLTQVIGRKRILLYSPNDSENLYPYEGKMLSNTSGVDPEKPDYTKFPSLARTAPFECHLYPGEILYIPPKWWHHVRALDVSFSVSFWWN